MVGYARRFVEVIPAQKVGADVLGDAGDAVLKAFAAHQRHGVGGAQVQRGGRKSGVGGDVVWWCHGLVPQVFNPLGSMEEVSWPSVAM